MANQFVIDLNPLTIYTAIEALDNEYPDFNESIVQIMQARREGDGNAMLFWANELADVLESVMHDPDFVSGWKDSADLLIAPAA